MYLLLGLILSGVLLAIYFKRGRNTVWGGATVGLILGCIVGIFKGDFLVVLGWGFCLGTLSGFGADLLGTFGDRSK